MDNRLYREKVRLDMLSEHLFLRVPIKSSALSHFQLVLTLLLRTTSAELCSHVCVTVCYSHALVSQFSVGMMLSIARSYLKAVQQPLLLRCIARSILTLVIVLVVVNISHDFISSCNVLEFTVVSFSLAIVSFPNLILRFQCW